MDLTQLFKSAVFHCLLALGFIACGAGSDKQSKISGSNICEVAFLDANTTQFQVVEAVKACDAGGPAPPKPSPAADPERICDRQKFLSQDAVKCLAKEKSFPPGIDEWSLFLSFDSASQRVVWNVKNVVSRQNASNWDGQLLVLDAVGGQELEQLQISVRSN